MLRTILIVFLTLVIIGAFPAWPHSRNLGYFPSGIGGTLLIVVIVLLLLGRL